VTRKGLFPLRLRVSLRDERYIATPIVFLFVVYCRSDSGCAGQSERSEHLARPVFGASDSADVVRLINPYNIIVVTVINVE